MGCGTRGGITQQLVAGVGPNRSVPATPSMLRAYLSSIRMCRIQSLVSTHMVLPPPHQCLPFESRGWHGGPGVTIERRRGTNKSSQTACRRRRTLLHSCVPCYWLPSYLLWAPVLPNSSAFLPCGIFRNLPPPSLRDRYHRAAFQAVGYRVGYVGNTHMAAWLVAWRVYAIDGDCSGPGRLA